MTYFFFQKSTHRTCLKVILGILEERKVAFKMTYIDSDTISKNHKESADFFIGPKKLATSLMKVLIYEKLGKDESVKKRRNKR